MQQRRPRLGDILDDYCPRERRITNHAVVAMIEDEVKQTRCTTCDADHEYKAARLPPQRRKRHEDGAADPLVPGRLRPTDDDIPADEGQLDDEGAADGEAFDSEQLNADGAPDDETGEDEARLPEDDGPVHRRLIRATLPRQEGQVPERKEPEFTVRQPGMRGPDGRTKGGGGGGGRGRRPMRGPQPQGGGGWQGQSSRQGSGSGFGQGQPRQGGGGPRQGGAPGNRGQGGPGGPRGNRPGAPPAGGRAGGGRKRGR